MSELEQALAAVEAGEKKQAYALIARLIKREPNHVAGWYTLSTLVDNEAKEQTFLQKVLALEPNHEAARRRLAEITGTELDFEAEETAADSAAESDTTVVAATPVTGSSSDTTNDFKSQAAGDSIPDWLMGEGEDAVAPPTVVAPAVTPAAAETETEDLPDWLQEEEDDPWAEPEEEKEAAAVNASPAPATTAATPAPPPTPAVDNSRFYDWLLYGLAFVAILLVLVLVVLVAQANLF